MKRITSIFLKGLAAVLPAVITLWALWWLASTAEKVLGGLLRAALPESWYLPGLGVVTGLVVVFAVGVLLHAWFVRALYEFFERQLEKLPLVKTVYGSVKDLLGFFVSGGDATTDQVVVIRFNDGSRQMRVLGFVTRDRFDDLPRGVGDDDMVAVYVPMSYQIGGFTVMVTHDCIEAIDMTTEEALRFAVTAGLTTTKKAESPRETAPAKAQANH
jgi:uncharacterized membrane protein